MHTHKIKGISAAVISVSEVHAVVMQNFQHWMQVVMWALNHSFTFGIGGGFRL